MYTEISETELYARLHFYENHTQYLNSELEKSNRKSAEQAEEIKELKNELNRITDFLRLAGKKIYGSSTEKICEAYGQLSFFDDAEENESEAVPVAPKKVKSYTRKEKRSYDEMLRDMPRKIVVHSLSEEEKICSVCGSEMSVIGYDSFLQVEYHRATIEVVEHRKEKAVCKSCDRNNEKSTFKTAASPTPLIERSYVSPSLLAHIICEKYVKAVPLYRLEQELNSYGWRISRQTMDNWILGAADIFKPLYRLLHGRFVREKIIHADETPSQTNRVRGKSKPVKGYMWVYRTGKYSDIQIVLYDYRNGRKAEYAKAFLEGFSGYLHCDGLRQYDEILDAVRVGCWAHLRRYFLKSVNVQHNKNDFSTLAGQAVMKINEIFHVEGRNPEKPYEKSSYSLEEIAQIREEKSVTLAESFFKWCSEKLRITAPKSLTGKAFGYALSQKNSLMNAFADPRLELTNNAAERAVKPFVIGRKNWLFAHAERGAHANAVLYSIIETAKANLLKPYEYVKWVLECIRDMRFKGFEDFLPWSGNIPENLRLES